MHFAGSEPELFFTAPALAQWFNNKLDWTALQCMYNYKSAGKCQYHILQNYISMIQNLPLKLVKFGFQIRLRIKMKTVNRTRIQTFCIRLTEAHIRQWKWLRNRNSKKVTNKTLRGHACMMSVTDPIPHKEFFNLILIRRDLCFLFVIEQIFRNFIMKVLQGPLQRPGILVYVLVIREIL